ncbi:uncharacterized protein LOC133744788 [Rosa rugosa]|uniref:uncharacterized protein LOC133744788 n=1 Tax=Rosa rugosa TaxID=74645 RepID=UPI002B4156B4|nr:uncharacterized protein LOC133744788 [Rosa rugosa]
MDKSWMHVDRRSHTYELGVEEFLKFAFENASDVDNICCLCAKCGGTDETFSIRMIKDHLYWNGIDESYKDWVWHGEPSRAKMNANEESSEVTVDMVEEEDGFSAYSNDFMKLVDDEDKPLYPGCKKHTKLNALIQTYNLKAKHGMSYVCYSDMLIMIGMFLPEGEHADATSCPTCGESRWKLGNGNIEKQGVPRKVLWYFPPIPRFKRMFQSTKTFKNLTWHASERRKDEFMRHPSDAPTWKLVDQKWPEFGNDPRNLRLALSFDGFNPHNSLSSRYSCWPVILVTYNLPPWLCMKRKFMMLTLLISGPKQPGNDIDVYLQPLIDDLKELWDGIDGVYDAFKGEYFKLKVVLFWIINDFPAYGNLSGSVTKGYNGCPICCENTKHYRLSHGQKMSHIGHQRWLPRHHPYRRQTKQFNNLPEFELAPERLSGEEVFKRVEGMNWPFGKKYPPPSYKGVEDETRPCWKKKSIFFELEYWKFLSVGHILDVMHIEKNVCDSIIGTLFNIPGKTKDGVVARMDMVDMGIRTGLGPKPGPKKDKLSLASWNLFLEEKRAMCMSFFNMKGPYGIFSNIRNLVSLDDLRLAICSKVIDVRELKKMQEDLVLTVCELEKCFPPSFFDIMINLTVHLVREVELCGPVFFRWMYHFERYMKTLKSYVRSRHHPEGCIAESYIAEEAMKFISERVLCGEDTVGIPSVGIFDESCTKPLSGASIVSVYGRELKLAHLNVVEALGDSNNDISDSLRWIADRVNSDVPTFSSYMVNGVRFNTKERDDVTKVQNNAIWEMDYNKFRIPVFKCDWVENAKGIKVDEFGFTLIMTPSTRRPSSQALAMAERMREIQLRTRSTTKRSNGATSIGTKGSVHAASKLSSK